MYDYHLPAWTFLPINLDHFIEFEEQDFRRRQEALANDPESLQPRRKSPSADDYLAKTWKDDPDWPQRAIGGAYHLYDMPAIQPKLHEPKCAWHGAPIAPILHAIRAINGPVSPSGFIPPDIKGKLRFLQELYERDLEIPGDVRSRGSKETNSINVDTSGSASAIASASSPPVLQCQARSRSQGSPTSISISKDLTSSRPGSPRAQSHLSVTHNNEKGKKDYSHVLVYTFEWGPQSTTDEKIQKILS